MNKLNLGCGRDYKDGWQNWDISKAVKAERYIDIRTEDFNTPDTFDEIYCSGVLEQILENEQLIHVMNECWRSLKVGGQFIIVVPSAKFANAFRDPMDCRQFTEPTFQYFIEGTHEWKNYGSVYGFFEWRLSSIITNERGIMTAILVKP